MQGVVIVAVVLSAYLPAAPSQGEDTDAKESFTATAVANDNLGSGVGTLLIDITRWSPEAERARLVELLLERGQDALLDEIRDNPSVGTIRTPASLAYDLRYAQQTPAEDGGREILLLTDRPIPFWEASTRPRSIEYPFTVIQMKIDGDGRGTGTLSFATRITATGRIIVLEEFTSAPVALNDIRVEKKR